MSMPNEPDQPGPSLLKWVLLGGAAVTLIMILIGAGTALFAVTTVVGSISGHQAAQNALPATAPCTPDDATSNTSADLDTGEWPKDPVVGEPTGDQLKNAQQILQAGAELNVPDFGQIVALAVAARESGWRNIGHGDSAGPDSRGLFQQRASWGAEKDRMDPTAAARLFYKALLAVPGWQAKTIGAAGQAVQRSGDATGGWYAIHEPIARKAFTHLNGTTPQAACGSNGLAMTCPATTSPAEEGLTPDALKVIRCLHQTFPELKAFGGVGDRPANVDDDHQTGRAVDAMVPNWSTPEGKKLGTKIATWAKSNYRQLGVKYVIWNARIWSVQRNKEGWHTYANPNGDNPTAAHLDHVHVSVNGDSAGGTETSGTYHLPTKNYVLTARYGQSGGRWARLHTGLDFATNTGQPITAVADGKVVIAGPGGAYGQWTCIAHSSRTRSCYAHQSAIGVQVGQRVKAGQTIGRVGATGNVTGPHLHLEIRLDGQPVDPEPWLRKHGLRP